MALGVAFALPAMSQNSVPAPGSGGGFNPNPANGIGWNPGPAASSAPAPGAGGGYRPGGGMAWGNPWGPGPGMGPQVVVNLNPGFVSGMNSGVCNVVGVGYDAQGIWRTIPMTVSYNWNGAQYSVQVLNAWNPWTDMWNRGVDASAYNTAYYLRGTTYDFYTVLSTGTYYFNL